MACAWVSASAREGMRTSVHECMSGRMHFRMYARMNARVQACIPRTAPRTAQIQGVVSCSVSWIVVDAMIRIVSFSA